MKITPEQRKYYFGVVVKAAAKYYEENQIDLIRDIIKAVKADCSPEFIHTLFEMMFELKTVSSSQDKELMIKFTDDIREHFWHEYGCDIPPANEPPINQGEQQ